MNRFLDPIRPTVRAVIFRDGDLLAQVKQKPGKRPYLTLPGGKQDPGESMEEALIRECAEEIGARVTVGPLLHVAEVHKPKADGLRHQVEMLFACALPASYTPRLGPAPDRSQVDTVWASVHTRQSEFKPGYARLLTAPDAPLYLGVLDG